MDLSSQDHTDMPDWGSSSKFSACSNDSDISKSTYQQHRLY